jgi:hypothetical protein
MIRRCALACLLLAGLGHGAAADDAGRYDVVVVPSPDVTPADKTEALLIDHQTGRTWVLTTEYDDTLRPQGTFWVPQKFKPVAAGEEKSLLPPN